ncbi:MAG: hypothetical protein WAN03_04405 [Candidatus Sulfotelmatobacter sp.]
MSNSSRIEAATRQHVGAVLTNDQIMELVKLADPTNTKGVYPSDVAYKRTPEGLVCRGKVPYGDGILEYLGENQFKVLADNEIIRRKKTVKTAAAAPAALVPPAAASASSGKKKSNSVAKVQHKAAVIAKKNGDNRAAAQQ